MTVTASTDGTATRFGWWLGQLVRATVAVLVLGGLLGAALGAAQPSDVSSLRADLQDRRVAEVLFADSSSYAVPGLRSSGSHPVVRWKIVGSGWRTAPVGTESVSPDPVEGPVSSDSVEPVGSAGAIEADIRRQADAAGVPVSLSGPRGPRWLVQLATVTGFLLVLVLIGSPQPRRATKWAWFWFLLVPGGLGQLAWLAIEAPWSSRANREPEPLPHSRQTGDRRLTGGRALIIAGALGLLVTALGAVAASWLAS